MPWRNSPEDRARDARVYGDPEYKRNRQAVLRRAGGRCEKCRKRGRVQVDHVVPVSQGGSHALSNLQALCCGPGSCHSRKTAGEGGGYRSTRAAADPECAPRTQW